MDKLKVFTAFSGYDSQCMALDRLGINYELVGWSEIDKYAIQAHNAIYPQWANRNFGDISKIDWNDVPDFDLFTYSFPCQDISSAGQQRGLEEGSGTRSGLLWECKKAIEAKRPRYLLMENVKALVSKKFKPVFHKWMTYLDSLGYSSYAKVLNAKDFGIPQNRERIFVVSILGDEVYSFPQPFELNVKLKDILENVVDECYYISDKAIKRIIRNNGTDGFLVDINGASKTICSSCYKMESFDNYISCVKRGINSDNSMDIKDGIHKAQEIEIDVNSLVSEPNVLTPKRTEYGKRVRKDYERGYIQESRHNMTNLETKNDGVSNTITTVLKDNLLFEPSFVGYTRDDKGKITNRRLQNICNTIHGSTGSGGNTDCFVAEIYETLGRDIRDGLCIEVEEDLLGVPINTDRGGICRTIKAQYYKTGVANFKRLDGTAATGVADGYRIRKLTNRECFRLMGVSEENIDKIQGSGVSKTQQYKMAGNSIVVDVLYHIFRKLFIDKKQETSQLTLF